MQKQSSQFIARPVMIALGICLILATTLSLLSFQVKQLPIDIFQQMGINQNAADQKITNSILGGFLDQQGVQQAKNIATGERSAIVRDLISYTRKYVASPAFVQAYEEMRASYYPEKQEIQSPEDLRRQMIQQLEESVAQNEAAVKTADANLKPIFQEVLTSARQLLEEAKDPNNPQLAIYAENYQQMVTLTEQSFQEQVRHWEMEYPEDHQQFVKKRLQQFLDETDNIDFSAEVIMKNGKKVFVNPNYEHKGKRWKMAYRAGREVILPARELVQQWIAAIK